MAILFLFLAGGVTAFLLLKNSGGTSSSAAEIAAESFGEPKAAAENPAASAAEAGARPAVTAVEPQEPPDVVSSEADQTAKPAAKVETAGTVLVENVPARQSRPAAPPEPAILTPPPDKTTVRRDTGLDNFSLENFDLDSTNKNTSLAISALNIEGKAAVGITGLGEAGLGKDAVYRNRVAVLVQRPLKSPLVMTVYLPREYRRESGIVLRIWPVLVTQTQGYDDPWYTEIPVQELAGTTFEEIPGSAWIRRRLSLPAYSGSLGPDVFIHRLVINLSLSEVSQTAFVGLGEMGFGSAGPAGD
jgi:hypothetical protein